MVFTSLGILEVPSLYSKIIRLIRTHEACQIYRLQNQLLRNYDHVSMFHILCSSSWEFLDWILMRVGKLSIFLSISYRFNLWHIKFGKGVGKILIICLYNMYHIYHIYMILHIISLCYYWYFWCLGYDMLDIY